MKNLSWSETMKEVSRRVLRHTLIKQIDVVVHRDQQTEYEGESKAHDLQGRTELPGQITLGRLDHLLEEGCFAVDGVNLDDGLSQGEVHRRVHEIAADRFSVLGLLELCDEMFDDTFGQGIERFV